MPLKLTKIQWMRYGSRKTTCTAAKPERIMNWSAGFDILALGHCFGRHCHVLIDPWEQRRLVCSSAKRESARQWLVVQVRERDRE